MTPFWLKNLESPARQRATEAKLMEIAYPSLLWIKVTQDVPQRQANIGPQDVQSPGVQLSFCSRPVERPHVRGNPSGRSGVASSNGCHSSSYTKSNTSCGTRFIFTSISRCGVNGDFAFSLTRCLASCSNNARVPVMMRRLPNRASMISNACCRFRCFQSWLKPNKSGSMSRGCMFQKLMQTCRIGCSSDATISQNNLSTSGRITGGRYCAAGKRSEEHTSELQ